VTQTILLGLDGATFTVLEPLWQNGTMPFLREFGINGVRAKLQTIIPPLTAPAWTSLVTGRSPGHHGIFDFRRITHTSASMQERMATSTDVQSETLWAMVGRHGRQVASLNFPVMYPSCPVKGYAIAGWTPYKHLRKAFYPPDFYDKLIALPGFDMRTLGIDIEQERKAIQVLPKDQYEDWILHHIRREERWLEVVQFLIHNAHCDLVAPLFDGPDKIQHLCWRFIDPNFRAADASPWERKVSELCLSYFRRLDEILAKIVGLVERDASVFIVSDHGFGPTIELFYINAWLQQEGYLEWVAAMPYDNEDKMVMAESTRSIAPTLDWATTKACALGSGSNGIYIKVAHGQGEPGVPFEEYYSFRDQLKQKLLAYVDPQTGKPVVTRVFTREEVYPGPEMERAPDLTVQLRDGGFVSILNSDQPVKPRKEVMGTHHPEGIFFAAGPGIRRNLVVPTLSILDIAPLVLYSMGLPIPSDLEGRVPINIFEDAHVQAAPVQIGSPTIPPDLRSTEQYDTTLEPSAEAVIDKHLRALGYL